MRIDGVWHRSVRVDADDGWSVRILDQTRLPWAVEWLRLTDEDQVAHAIRSMQTRGAPLIGATAAYGVALAMRRDPAALEMEWTEIRRCARPGARILFRSAHKQPPFLQSVRTGPHREPLTQWLRFHAQLAEDLHARDRVHTYASFHIAEACHP